MASHQLIDAYLAGLSRRLPADTVDGSTGTDIYDASASDDAVFINLDTVAHDDGADRHAAGWAAIGTATADALATAPAAEEGFDLPKEVLDVPSFLRDS